MYLFNNVLKSGEVPQEWTTGLIIPIYKNKGDTTDASNYRGITLLSCMGKLFTTILNNRLTIFVENNEILNEYQTGFRRNYCTIDHCYVLKCIIDILFKNKKKLFCAFIDYQTAFDMVWRNALWFKLSKCGIVGNVYNVIVNMYKQIKSMVFANGETTDVFINKIGVRQGENLSPLLFSLYINDFEDYLLKQGCDLLKLDSDHCDKYLRLFILMYADDTAILANSEKGLQKALDALYNYCNRWKLKVNVSKTKVIIFSKRKVKKDKYKFTYDTNVIESVDSFKYLGITFNHNGKFNVCQKALINQASRAMYSILSKSRKLELPINIQLELFDKMVLPIMCYGCEVWGIESSKQLEALHLKFCKYILNMKTSTPNAMVYGELGRLPIELTVKIKMVMYWHKICSVNNNKLVNIMYNCIYNMYINNVFISPLLKHVHSILSDSGLNNIWLSQGRGIDCEWLKIKLHNILKDQYIQKWNSNLYDSSKLSMYRTYKQLFGFENYLLSRHTYLLKFRTLNHRLPIEKGRFNNTVRENRTCNVCCQNQIGDEFHYLLICKHEQLVKLRTKLIPRFYWQYPNLFKFSQLIASVSTNKTNAYNINKFANELFQIVK